MARLLLLDADAPIRGLLAAALDAAGIDADSADTADDAVIRYGEQRPELVVVSMSAANSEGERFLRRFIAAGERTPTIVLTDTSDAPQLAERGVPATWIVERPIDIDEVILRIRHLIASTPPDDDILEVGDLIIDARTGTATRAGVALALTPTEFRLLRLLAMRVDRVLTKREILDHVWLDENGTRLNLVETYISYVRRKLDRLGEPLIHTVRGVGYTLRRPLDPAPLTPSSHAPGPTASS